MANSLLPEIHTQLTDNGWNAWVSLGGVLCTPTDVIGKTEDDAIELSLTRFQDEMRGHAARVRHE